MMILPITLTIAGAAALLNFWLSLRVGQVRIKEEVFLGDEGNELVLRRMRAHSNFTEYTPIILILIGLTEMALGSSLWLWCVGGLYILIRIAHVFGMDGAGKARFVGAAGTAVFTVALGLLAIAIPYFAG